MIKTSIPLSGPAFAHRSPPVSAQVLKNMYIEVNPQTPESTILAPTPGSKSFITTAATSRGMHVMNGVLYQVAGQSLYQIGWDGTTGSATLLGTVAGTDPVIMDDDGTYLLIAAGQNGYKLDGSTLTTVTGGTISSANSVCFINRQACYLVGTNEFWVSDFADPSTINGLNYVVMPGNVLRNIAFKERVYFYTDKSITVWWNNGAGRPPFIKVQGAEQSIGLGGKHTLAQNEDLMYFLGNNRKVYQYNGSALRSIDDVALNDFLKDAPNACLQYAKGYCFSWFGTHFYALTINNKTWAYDERNNYWFQLSTGTQNGQHLMLDYAYCYGKHLIADYRNNKVLEWDFDTYTDSGAEIQRRRVTPPIDSSLFGLAGVRMFFSELELILERGVGIPSGQGSNPKVMMQYSDDGGETWSTERWRTIGASGKRDIKVKWRNLGMAYERCFRFTFTDPVKFVLRDLYATVELGSL